jgi:hypothetical protein
MKARIIRFAAAAVTVAGFAAPGLAAAHTGTITTTGPGSSNQVKANIHNDTDIDTHNRVDLRNRVDQDARSGNASARYNTTAGGVSTGTALNDQTSSASVDVSTDNTGVLAASADMGGGSNSGTIGTTGPNSWNNIEFNQHNNVDVDTHNDVSLHNNVDQDAHSGNASASYNTTVGDVSSGDAANYSTNSFNVSVSTNN